MNDFTEIDEQVVKLVLRNVLYCELCYYDHERYTYAVRWGPRYWNVNIPWPLCQRCYEKWLDAAVLNDMNQDVLQENYYRVRHTSEYLKCTTMVNRDQ